MSKVIVGISHFAIEAYCEKIVDEDCVGLPNFRRKEIYEKGKKRYTDVKRRKVKLEVTI